MQRKKIRPSDVLVFPSGAIWIRNGNGTCCHIGDLDKEDQKAIRLLAINKPRVECGT